MYIWCHRVTKTICWCIILLSKWCCNIACILTFVGIAQLHGCAWIWSFLECHIDVKKYSCSLYSCYRTRMVSNVSDHGFSNAKPACIYHIISVLNCVQIVRCDQQLFKSWCSLNFLNVPEWTAQLQKRLYVMLWGCDVRAFRYEKVCLSYSQDSPYYEAENFYGNK